MNVELFICFFQTICFPEFIQSPDSCPVLQITSISYSVRVRYKYTKYNLYSTIQVNNDNIDESQNRLLGNASHYIILI